MMDFLEGATVLAHALSADADYRQLSHSLLDHLYNTKALLILNTAREFDDETIRRLGVLVDHILERTKNIK